MTNASFTDMQAIVSMPLALNLSALCRKPGTCFAEQVGVNAPGRPNNTTFLLANRSSVLTASGPFSPSLYSVADGILSPTLIVMSNSHAQMSIVLDGSRPIPERHKPS